MRFSVPHLLMLIKKSQIDQNKNLLICNFSIVKPKPLLGALEVNHHLDKAEHILEGKVIGAEHLLPRGKSIYASLHNGNVVRIDGEHITFVAKFGKPCKYPEEESICGRPLGLAFDTISDNLLVVDAYYGLWEVNLKDGSKKQLVSPDMPIGINVSILLMISVLISPETLLSHFRFHVQQKCSIVWRSKRMATFTSHIRHQNLEWTMAQCLTSQIHLDVLFTTREQRAN